MLIQFSTNLPVFVMLRFTLVNLRSSNFSFILGELTTMNAKLADGKTVVGPKVAGKVILLEK